MDEILTLTLNSDQQKQLAPFVNSHFKYILSEAPNAPAILFMCVGRERETIHLQAAPMKWIEAKEVINLIRKFKGKKLIPIDKKKKAKKTDAKNDGGE